MTQPDKPQLSVEVIQGRGADNRYLLRTASGRYLRMAPSAFHLLVRRDRGATFEEIAESMNQRPGSDAVEPGDVEKAYQKVIARLRKIEETDSLTRSGFWLRLPLLSEAVVNLLAKPLGVLFRPLPSAALLGLLLIACVMFPQVMVSLQFSNESLIVGYVLMIVSVLVHEFGHASACAYYGARPRAIGFGIYLIYPVFYSDVSAAWELKNTQRVVVDVGGLYFQGIVGAIYLLLYIWLDWEPLLAGILMIMGSCIFSLNPIFRFDGYWIIADSLGVHNLSQQPIKLVGHFWNRLRGLPTNPLPWGPWKTVFLTAYSVLSFAVWGLFLWFIMPFFADRIVSYPEKFWTFAKGVMTGQNDGASDFLVSTYAFVLAAFILGRMSQGLLIRVWQFLRMRFFPPPPPAAEEKPPATEEKPLAVEHQDSVEHKD